jgi:heat shock protein HtpX
LLLGGLVVAGSLLWLIAPRRQRFQIPGPRLEASQHPRLFAEVERLAAALNEPMSREIYLISDVNAGVTERSGVMGFGSIRVMMLGWPMLQALTVSQFRAVLAHEFGHYGGDTKLGPWVYKTRAAMARTLVGLGEPNAALGALRGVAVIGLAYVVIVKVLVAYWNLFLRITQLVSRRQEYRADEFACYVAGSRSQVEGLRSFHGACAAFRVYAGKLSQILNAGYRPAVAEGFARFIAAPAIAKALATQIETALREERTKPLESHPC